MASNLKPASISVPVQDGKTVINYDIFVDPESGLDVDPQSGEMRTREQTIEMVQSVYSVGAETMSDELERYNKWIQDPENKAKAQKLMTANKPMNSNNDSQQQQASAKSSSSSASHTVFTPEMALEKAADCRKRGNDWLSQREYRKALRVYSEGLAYLHISQRCGMLLSNRAEVLIKMQRFDEAAVGAEEAMRRFELLAASGVVTTVGTQQKSNTNVKKETTAKSAGSSSTMEIIDDDDDDECDSSSSDDDEDTDIDPSNASLIKISPSMLQKLLSSSSVNDEAASSSNNKTPHYFFRLFGSRQHHTLPSSDSIGPQKSGGACGQNLRVLWLKAAFRLVRALEGAGQTWRALSVVACLLRKFSTRNSSSSNETLPNDKDWKEIGQRLLAKLQVAGVTKVIQIPKESAIEISKKQQQQNGSSNVSSSSQLSLTSHSLSTVPVAAPAVDNWPSFNAFTVKRGNSASNSTNGINFAPLFGWDEKNAAVNKLQAFINEKFLTPVLTEQKADLHSVHTLESNNDSNIANISKSLGIDSFGPFLLHLAQLLGNSKTEDEAKAFVVDAPVSLDRWLGRRPQFSYPVKESKESDFFFVVAETAARVVEWVKNVSDAEFLEYIITIESSSSSSSSLPSKMKNFAFTQERIVHVVFALSQIAHATRSTRNLPVSSSTKTKSESSSISWCWLEAPLIDASSRIPYESSLREYSASLLAKENKKNVFATLKELVFPALSEKSSSSPTFTPESWGTVKLVEKDECGSFDGDQMIPVLWFDNREDGQKGNSDYPRRFGHAGFYGEICS